MNNFSYVRADDVLRAVGAIASSEAGKFIAGGTNILDLIKVNVTRPTDLIDINRLPLNRIEETPDGGLRIGALVTNANTAEDRLVKERYPMLAQAILAGASAQLRNMATTAGTFYNGPGATTSMTQRLHATSENRVRTVLRLRASIESTPSWVRTKAASPLIRPICVSLLLLLRRSFV
jgi:CO/xanthine dehydrogenase FAD-binding subunit